MVGISSGIEYPMVGFSSRIEYPMDISSGMYLKLLQRGEQKLQTADFRCAPAYLPGRTLLAHIHFPPVLTLLPGVMVNYTGQDFTE